MEGISPLVAGFFGLMLYAIPIVVVYLFWDELRDINRNLESIAEELRKRSSPS